MLRGHPAHPNTTMYWSVQALQCTAPGRLSLGTLPTAAHRCLRSRLTLQHSTQIPTTESTLRALTASTQCLADPLNTNQKSNTKPIHNHYLIFPARQKESSLTPPFALRSHIRAMCGFKAKACSGAISDGQKQESAPKGSPTRTQCEHSLSATAGLTDTLCPLCLKEMKSISMKVSQRWRWGKKKKTEGKRASEKTAPWAISKHQRKRPPACSPHVIAVLPLPACRHVPTAPHSSTSTCITCLLLWVPGTVTSEQSRFILHRKKLSQSRWNQLGSTRALQLLCISHALMQPACSFVPNAATALESVLALPLDCGIWVFPTLSPLFAQCFPFLYRPTFLFSWSPQAYLFCLDISAFVSAAWSNCQINFLRPSLASKTDCCKTTHIKTFHSGSDKGWLGWDLWHHKDRIWCAREEPAARDGAGQAAGGNTYLLQPADSEAKEGTSHPWIWF